MSYRLSFDFGGSPVASPQIKVLVVDDSAFMRNALGRMISDEPGLLVIGKARNGLEAIDQIREKNPDLITLDIEMPEMDGLTALRLIRQFSKVPVLMVSSLTSEGSMSSLKALRYGASDVLAKDHSMVSANIHELQDELINKIRALVTPSGAVKPPKSQPTPPSSPGVSAQIQSPHEFDIIVVGASTGAPPHLELIAKSLSADLLTPIIIAQHMPPVFTASLAQRLDALSPRQCLEARHGMRIEPGMLVIAPGGAHTRIARLGDGLVTRISDRPEQLIYKPSVDELFTSAAEVSGARTLGIVLTGMGNDGCLGAQQIHNAGGKIITQEAGSCVVYGMPKAVDDAGISNARMTPEQLAEYLMARSAMNETSSR